MSKFKEYLENNDNARAVRFIDEMYEIAKEALSTWNDTSEEPSNSKQYIDGLHKMEDALDTIVNRAEKFLINAR